MCGGCGLVRRKVIGMEGKQKSELWNEQSEEVAGDRKTKKYKYWILTIIGVCLLAGIVALILMPKSVPLADENFPNWGLTLSVKDVTPSGLTLVCTQSGGEVTGELITGESYYLMKVKNKKGKYLPNVRGGYDFDFNAVAYLIPLNTDTEFNVDWKQMYGELKPGKYRLVKEFTEYRENGNHNEADYWVEFVIE